MTETHNYSAFQGKSGLIITSSSREESFFFIKCIKMKQNNMWERPSLKEGITVKIGLEELGNMVAVVNHKCQTCLMFTNIKIRRLLSLFPYII